MATEIEWIRTPLASGLHVAEALSRKLPLADVEIGHRTISVCHLAGITRRLNRKLTWDPETERFDGDAEANALLRRPRRKGYELPKV